MKQKIKIIEIILSLLLLSGCSFDYNIILTSNGIEEDNIVYLENSTKNNISNDIENIVNKYTGPTNSLGMYKQSIIKKDNIYGVSYKSNYTISEYNDSISFTNCFEHSKITRNNEEIEIATSTGFKCFDKYEELEKVTVKLKTDLEVISSNANQVEKGNYIWYITKQNADNTQLNIRVNNKKTIENSKSNRLQTTIFFIGILAIVVFIWLVIKARGKRKNKI